MASLPTLAFRRPDHHLEVGSGSHAVQTAEVMKRFEPVLESVQPQAVLVVGDVNSTIACALVAAKRGVRVIHVEAGLRSYDRSMPEEINRVLTDQISDLLFTTEKSALANLQREGIDPARVEFVGNVMIDTLYRNLERAVPSSQTLGATLPGYAVLTLHRPSNVDDPATLAALLDVIGEINRVLPVVLPLHPRTRGNIEKFGLTAKLEALRILPPLGYLDMLGLMRDAKLVLTDSGGIQEETTALGVPCLTLRDNTERPITLTEGTNTLVGADPAAIRAAFQAGDGERRPGGLHSGILGWPRSDAHRAHAEGLAAAARPATRRNVNGRHEKRDVDRRRGLFSGFSVCARPIRREDWDSMPCRVERNIDVILGCSTRRMPRRPSSHSAGLPNATRKWCAVLSTAATNSPAMATATSACRTSRLNSFAMTSPAPSAFSKTSAASPFAVIARRAFPSTRKTGGRSKSWKTQATCTAPAFIRSSTITTACPMRRAFPHHPNGADGILELPPTTLALMGRNLPAAGGGWFRLLPYSMSRWMLQRVNAQDQAPCMFYFHPWEIDAGQPRQPGLSAKTRFRHYVNLQRMPGRMRQIAERF